MNEMDKKTFVLHDESVNTYGFRMLTSGANLDEFRKNPVMLLNHSDWSLPIGRWENIRVEDGKILADAVFDESDERGREVARKVADGFVRMASIGAWPPEQVSDAYDLTLPGQTGATVTKWTVREASIVTIGANHNALAMYDVIQNSSGKIQNLGDADVRMVDRENPGGWARVMYPGRYDMRDHSSNHHQYKNNMGKLTEILKLNDTASEQEIAVKVSELIANNDRLASENKTLSDAIEAQKAKQKAKQKTEAIALLDAAVKDGRIDASGKDAYIKLFDADFDGAKAALAAIPQRRSVAGMIREGAQVNLGDWEGKSWDELDKAGKLVQLKDQNYELYKQKFKERYGVEIHE